MDANIFTNIFNDLAVEKIIIIIIRHGRSFDMNSSDIKMKKVTTSYAAHREIRAERKTLETRAPLLNFPIRRVKIEFFATSKYIDLQAPRRDDGACINFNNN